MYGAYLVLLLAAARPSVSADAGSFVEAAERSLFFYDTGWREPLQPFLLNVATWGEPTVMGLRIVCAIASMLCLLALMTATERKFGAAAGGLAALAWMLNPYIGAYAAQGDRLTLTALLLFIFAFALYEMPRGRFRFALLAVAGAMLPLARSETAFIVIAASCVRIFSRRDRAEAMQVGAALAVAMMLYAPYPAVEWIRTGNPFYGSAMHARFWANHEFVGTPLGMHATFAEVLRDEYRGGPLSPARYIFGMHAPATVVARYASGYARLATVYLPRYAVGAAFLSLFTLCGCVVAARRSVEEIFFVVLCHFPLAFIYSLDQVYPGSGVEARFVLQTAPFIAAWTAVGIVSAARAARRIGLQRAEAA